MRRSLSFLPVFLFGLFLVHGAGLFFAIRRLPRFPGGKAVVPLALFALFAVAAYAILLFLHYRSIRAGTIDARVAVRRGLTLVVLGTLWAMGSAFVVWNEITAISLGLFALAGMVAWYPLVLAGSVFLLAVRRQGDSPRHVTR